MDYLKMIKKYLSEKRVLRILMILTIIFLIAWLLSGQTEKKILTAGDCEFEVELALNSAEQYRGLSHRDDLKNNEGMLFIFSERKDQTFVMRDMNFPLDIIFIRDFKVVNLYHNLKPEGPQPNHSYHSGSPVDAVLEIKGGLSQACKIAINTEVNW